MAQLHRPGFVAMLSSLAVASLLPITAAQERLPAFPVEGLLPKTETGAARFLAAHPDYDGRGVVIAIFDTGVDPGADGLQTSTEGKPKLVDMIDGTGSGDVDTSSVREATDHKLQGLSGRTLELDPAWQNPTGKFHVGLKRGFDLFPDGDPYELVPRLKRERREEFDRSQQQAEAALRQQLIEWEAAHPRPSDDDRAQRKELDARLEQLQAAAKNYDDPGHFFDCIVFHDGQKWRAAVDTDEDGNLAEEKLLTNFRDERQFATFGDKSLMNFAANIYDDGKLLSIVTDAGAHGTHVAGIVAGHFPQQPELNGIAPGAQIVSVRIGDMRLGSMETGSGLIRGLAAVRANDCDLINMSYGEPTSTPDRGFLTSLLAESVREEGVIFVASAGNAGPALSTVGAPGGTTSGIIGVGAYVSPAMMAAEYALRDMLPELPYTWTSRGPTADGDLGVDLFAPGGAIAPVPNWMLRRSLRMNGTSMASPNACGSIALVVSGLKATGTAYTPFSIQRAFQNTARTVATADVFAQGGGLIQVDRAYDYLLEHAGTVAQGLQFDVRIRARGDARGIYLREPVESNRPLTTQVAVSPVYPEDADNRAKVALDVRIALESTAEWVSTGGHLQLAHGRSEFEVRVDPTALKPGAHFAEIRGYDAAGTGRGPLFRVPITVLRAAEFTSLDRPELEAQFEFEPAEIVRQFLHVPAGATWADLSLRLRETADGPRRFLVHAVQVLPGESFEAGMFQQYLGLAPGKEVVRSFPVTGDRTLELCLAQFWSSLGRSTVDCRLTFRGLLPDQQTVDITSARPYAAIVIDSPLGSEQLSPQAALTTWRSSILPDSAALRPLSERESLRKDGRLYELLLTYKFEQAKSGAVTPRFPFDDLLYDSPLAYQLWSIYDSAERRVTTDDMFPQAVQLAKGTYTLRLQLWHSDPARLEGLKQLLLRLDRGLEKSVPLAAYQSRADALGGGVKFEGRLLAQGEQARFVISGPARDLLPKSACAGDLLLGTIRYGSKDDGVAGAGERPGGFPVRFGLSAAPSKQDEAPQERTDDAKPSDAEALLAFQVDQLKKIPFETERERFEAAAQAILVEHPNHLPVLATRLERLDNEEHREQRLPEIVAAADAALTAVDRNVLRTALAARVNPDDPTAVKKRSEDEKLRDTLVDILYRKGRALGYMELPEVMAEHPIADREQHERDFEQNFAELRSWVDTTEPKYFLLHVRRDRRKERFGQALALLNRHIPESEPNYWYFKKRRDLYQDLGWKHLAELESRRLLNDFPGRSDE